MRLSTEDVEVRTPQAAAAVLAGDTPAPEAPTEVLADGPSRSAEAPPRLAAGVELIGEFENSGFKQPPYIARRADGQVVQMPRMLFMLAEQIDGVTGLEGLTERYSHAIERR